MELRWRAEIYAEDEKAPLEVFDDDSRDGAFGKACQSDLFRSMARCIVVLRDQSGVVPTETRKIGPIKDRYSDWE